ncbi:VWA domain-containing protein [Nocardioides sp. GXZ039]|uniref:VWA domain-containing protein n=1 Tax=Nocardioides sp. GXZ039 TaxID=3136018 RepID=UPI0030F42BD0
MTLDDERRARWRLVLGRSSEAELGPLTGTDADMDRALGFLYDRSGAAGDGDGDRAGDPDASSVLSTTEWLSEVHRLFPTSVADKITADALDRYGLTEIVTDPHALATATPNVSLLKAILATKHLMSPEVLAQARKIVADVVRELMRTLARPVTSPFSGRRDPRRRSRQPIAANFDAQGTIRANLRHVDRRDGRRRLVIAQPLFNTRVRLHQNRWQVVVAVDQSGSMADSVIHASVTAAIFHGLDVMRTHLVVFDTEVVDLTGEAGDPVEVLMRVQLGGGTLIGKAVAYCRGLLDNPRRSIVVVISDFHEGDDPRLLLDTVAKMVADGVRVLCLPALDTRGQAAYDRSLAEALAAQGADVGVMTPDQLAAWVAEVVG